jgi:hypothetical protein
MTRRVTIDAHELMFALMTSIDLPKNTVLKFKGLQAHVNCFIVGTPQMLPRVCSAMLPQDDAPQVEVTL